LLRINGARDVADGGVWRMSDPRSETKTEARARAARNVVIAVALAVFVVLIFVVTVVRLKANVAT